jgi:hypothetical protein
MMTLNRYLLVGKDHSEWLITVAKLEFKLVIRGSLLLSALINLGHGWEYQAVKDLALTLYMGRTFDNFDIYEQANGGSYSDYPEANKDMSYFVYSIVYFVINFGVFFTLNTAFEVKIVRRMHKELKEKRERIAKMNASATTNALTEGAKTHMSSKKQTEKEDEDGQKERKVIKMVVLYGFFNFFLRAPEVLFWIENKKILSVVFPVGSFDSVDLSNQFPPGLLSLIADIGYLTYILTFTTNFLIFFFFNKNFKTAIVSSFSLGKSKIQT